VSDTSLLDVNVLLALFDPDHVHHDVAHDWFADHDEADWASCPLTENGFLRTARVARTSTFVSIPELVDRLRKFQTSTAHQFWADDITLLDENLLNVRAIHGTRQLTDIFLLALAVRRGGRLVTFDARIPLAAVKSARPEHLVVLAPSE
jgi:toxin-antitoxin system PIN domain toxin